MNENIQMTEQKSILHIANSTVSATEEKKSLFHEILFQHCKGMEKYKTQFQILYNHFTILNSVQYDHMINKSLWS